MRRPDHFLVGGDGRRGVGFVLHCPDCDWELEWQDTDVSLRDMEELALAHMLDRCRR